MQTCVFVKAQFELVKRGEDGLEVFIHALTESKNQLARVHSVWGISQLARKDIKHAKNLVSFLKDSDPEIRAQAAAGLVMFAIRKQEPN